jgi:cyclopropane fatty-acyl-phospholipid synthase-like methyltransferase
MPTRNYHRAILTLVLAMTIPVVLAAEEKAEPEYDDLLGQLTAAEKSGEYEKALGLAEQMVEITFPRHIEATFNLARMHALTGDPSRAYEYLYLATDSGFWDAKRMLEDDAFETLREDELFKKLARKAWSNGYLWMLERDQREEYQEKEKVLEALSLKPGSFVVDVGAGSGYFSIPVARAIGPEGTLLATDIRQEMLDYIDRRAAIEQLDNIELLLAEPDDPMLPPGKADLILMVDVYHYIQDGAARIAFGKKLREGLAPGGRLVVIDFIPKPWEERPWGPPESQHLSEETLTADLAQAGLKRVAKHDFISEQFFVVYQAE